MREIVIGLNNIFSIVITIFMYRQYQTNYTESVTGKTITKEVVYGEFYSKDLLVEWLESNKSIERTTQFDSIL